MTALPSDLFSFDTENGKWETLLVKDGVPPQQRSYHAMTASEVCLFFSFLRCLMYKLLKVNSTIFIQQRMRFIFTVDVRHKVASMTCIDLICVIMRGAHSRLHQTYLLVEEPDLLSSQKVTCSFMEDLPALSKLTCEFLTSRQKLGQIQKAQMMAQDHEACMAL